MHPGRFRENGTMEVREGIAREGQGCICLGGTPPMVQKKHRAFENLKDLKVVIATGFHLFPFRTEKLSPSAPMVLRKRESRSPPTF